MEDIRSPQRGTTAMSRGRKMPPPSPSLHFGRINRHYVSGNSKIPKGANKHGYRARRAQSFASSHVSSLTSASRKRRRGRAGVRAGRGVWRGAIEGGVGGVCVCVCVCEREVKRASDTAQSANRLLLAQKRD
jgi:hypothetical protein